MDSLETITAEVAKDMDLHLFRCGVPFCKGSILFPTLKAALAHAVEKHPNATRVGTWLKSMMKLPIGYSTEELDGRISEFNRRVERKLEEAIRKKIGMEIQTGTVTTAPTTEVIRKQETKLHAIGIVRKKEAQLPVVIPDAKRKADMDDSVMVNTICKRYKEGAVDSSISKKNEANNARDVMMRPCESSTAVPDTVVKSEPPAAALNNVVYVGAMPEPKGILDNNRVIHTAKGQVSRKVHLATSTPILFFNVRKDPTDQTIAPSIVLKERPAVPVLVKTELLTAPVTTKGPAVRSSLETEIKAILENSVTRRMTLRLRRVKPFKIEPDVLCPVKQIAKLLRKD